MLWACSSELKALVTFGYEGLFLCNLLGHSEYVPIDLSGRGGHTASMSIADPSATGGRKPSRFSAARASSRTRGSQKYDHTTPVPETRSGSTGNSPAKQTGANYDPSAPTQAISIRKRRSRPTGAGSPGTSSAASTPGSVPAQSDRAGSYGGSSSCSHVPSQVAGDQDSTLDLTSSRKSSAGFSRRSRLLSRAAQRAKERYQSPSIGLALMFSAILVVLAAASGAMPFLFSQSILMQLSAQYGPESAQTSLGMIHAFALVVAVVRVLLWSLTLRFIARGSSWIRIGATFVAVLDMGARLVSMNGQVLPGKQPLDLFAVACCLLLVVALWLPSSHEHFAPKRRSRRH